MKKSVVALGVIVALGAVGVGGAWLPGKKHKLNIYAKLN